MLAGGTCTGPPIAELVDETVAMEIAPTRKRDKRATRSTNWGTIEFSRKDKKRTSVRTDLDNIKEQYAAKRTLCPCESVWNSSSSQELTFRLRCPVY